MKIRPSIAFAGVAAFTALAFAPAITTAPVDAVVGDGKARALAAGELDLRPGDALSVGDLTEAGVPFGVTAPCTAGFAGPFPCDGVDLASYVPLAELGGGGGSDSWGWYDDGGTPDDESDDRQIALMGTTFGLTYTDITNPNIPVVLGRTLLTPSDDGVLWRDVKVANDHAYFVSEQGGYGVKVIDLTALRSDTALTVANEVPIVGSWIDEAGGNSHNIWVNEATDRAYVLGTGAVGNQDTGGTEQTILDISDPANPVDIGKIDAYGYTHDAQCVVYTGPDADYNGDYEGGDADGDASNGNQAELCFLANERWMRVVDVTDAANTKLIATIEYQSAEYAHQSVVTEDMRWLLWNDELDETNGALAGTRGEPTTTYWTDISDLDLEIWQDESPSPELVGPANDNVCVYESDTISIDHNMYITGDLLWQANYNAGLRVFRLSDEGLENCEMELVAHFDVDPGLDINAYGGAWNVYPFFGQDQIIVSTLDEGLYVLQTDLEVNDEL